jgi:hypothetical protein
MMLAAVFLTAIIAVTAIGVEVSRLATVATETQIAADAAALAAAKNLFGVSGATQTTARAAGQAVAAQNQIDGRFPAAADVNIEFGTYSAASGWGSGTDPAIRATVTMQNVRYLLATALNIGNFHFGTQTTVTKRALAEYTCQENGRAIAPFTIGDCQLQSYTVGHQCSGNNPVLITTYANNMCWIANNSNDTHFLPAPCGAGDGTPFSVGDVVNATNGTVDPVYRDLQSCVGATCVFPGETGPGVHDYTIPIIPCVAGSVANCNNGTSDEHVVGFATIHISCGGDIGCAGCRSGSGWPVSPGSNVDTSQGKWVTFTQICNNDASGGGGNNGGGTECFGSGTVKLVADRAGT